MVTSARKVVEVEVLRKRKRWTMEGSSGRAWWVLPVFLVVFAFKQAYFTSTIGPGSRAVDE